MICIWLFYSSLLLFKQFVFSAKFNVRNLDNYFAQLIDINPCAFRGDGWSTHFDPHKCRGKCHTPHQARATGLAEESGKRQRRDE